MPKDRFGGEVVAPLEQTTDRFGGVIRGPERKPGPIASSPQEVERIMRERYPQAYENPDAPKSYSDLLPKSGGDVMRSAGNFLKGFVVNPIKGMADTARMVVAPPPELAPFNAMGPGGALFMKTALAHADTLKKAQDAAKRGDYVSAAGYGMATALPGIGPGAAATGEKIGEGKVAEGLGEGLFAVAGPAIARKAFDVVLPPAKRQAAAEWFYQSALKPNKARGNPQDLTRTALSEEIPLGYINRRKAVDTARARIGDIDDAVQSAVDAGAVQGKRVNVNDAANATDRSLDVFHNQVNPESDVSAIGASKNEFLRTQGAQLPPEVHGPVRADIPIDAAQALKKGTYKQLRDKYGELGAASVEAQKDLARGLMDGVYDQLYAQYPQLRQLASREGKLIELEPALMDYARRFGNNDLIGIGPGVTASGFGKYAGLARAFIDNPAVKSRIAIMLSKSAKPPIPGTPLGNVAGIAGRTAAGLSPSAERLLKDRVILPQVQPPPQNRRNQ